MNFKEDYFLKDDKVDHQNDGRENRKAIVIELHDQIHEAAMHRPIDLATDQPSSNVGSFMDMDHHSASDDSPTLDSFQQSAGLDPLSSERFQPSDNAGSSSSSSSPRVDRYNMARDRQRREVRPPIRYEYFELDLL